MPLCVPLHQESLFCQENEYRELTEPYFTLFQRVPNFAQHGPNASLWLPHPLQQSRLALGMFKLVGRLMAFSLRNKVPHCCCTALQGTRALLTLPCVTHR